MAALRKIEGMKHRIDEDGFSMVPEVLPPDRVAGLALSLGAVSGAGNRGMLAHPAVAELAGSEAFLNLVRPHLPEEPVPVRAILFDKSPETNWLVPWHQDLTLALPEKREIAGFGPWSVKDGIPHVQPPVELLERMLTLRLHFDDTDETNGALRVIPGSHLQGKLSASQIQEQRDKNPECHCVVPAGGVLLMRPLLLHASSRSTRSGHRRVLHIEYAGFALPEGLHWREAG